MSLTVLTICFSISRWLKWKAPEVEKDFWSTSCIIYGMCVSRYYSTRMAVWDDASFCLTRWTCWYTRWTSRYTECNQRYWYIPPAVCNGISFIRLATCVKMSHATRTLFIGCMNIHIQSALNNCMGHVKCFRSALWILQPPHEHISHTICKYLRALSIISVAVWKLIFVRRMNYWQHVRNMFIRGMLRNFLPLSHATQNYWEHSEIFTTRCEYSCGIWIVILWRVKCLECVAIRFKHIALHMASWRLTKTTLVAWYPGR
jgi:hypothetical protein